MLALQNFFLQSTAVTCQKLINNRAFDKSLLDISIFRELPEVIDRLLDVEGLDINSGDSKGITALAFA